MACLASYACCQVFQSRRRNFPPLYCQSLAIALESALVGVSHWACAGESECHTHKVGNLCRPWMSLWLPDSSAMALFPVFSPNTWLNGGRNVRSEWLELPLEYHPHSESLAPGICAVVPSIPTFLLDYFSPAFQKATHTWATGTPAAQGWDRHMKAASH